MINYSENKENRGCGCHSCSMQNNPVNENTECGCSNNQEVEVISFTPDCGCKNQRDEQREEMMNQIRALDFAIVELGEYLDTHPESSQALCLHREYTKQVKQLKDQYQKIYGPLTIYFPCNKWRWLEEPWPWERGNY